MRRFFFSLLAFLFGLVILVISLWSARTNFISLALETTAYEREVSTIAAEQVESIDLEYDLPYPGILPDHPLYFLKMIRDRIQLWITRKPLAKAELMLHYADKRFAAALKMAEVGKSGLAVSTSMKAAYYLDRALNEVEKAAASGVDAASFYEKSRAAANKHKAVLKGIVSRIPDGTASGINGAVQTNEQSWERIENYFGKEGAEEIKEEQVLREDVGDEKGASESMEEKE